MIRSIKDKIEDIVTVQNTNRQVIWTTIRLLKGGRSLLLKFSNKRKSKKRKIAEKLTDIIRELGSMYRQNQ